MKTENRSAGWGLSIAWILLTAGHVAAFDEPIELTKLNAAVPDNNNLMGISAALDGDLAVIGASNARINGVRTGAARVFDTSTGQELWHLTASDGAATDAFGCSVDLDGNTAIIGARGDENQTGAAYVFDLTTGQELLKLTASNGSPTDSFGYSVAISGNTAIVGIPEDTHQGNTDAGTVLVFDVTTGAQLRRLTANDASANDYFGWSVDLDGNTAIIGADGNNAAYVFNVDTGQQLRKLTAPSSGGDRFGGAVAIDGNIAVIGAAWDDPSGSQSGSAYLFDVTTGQQLFMLTADDGEADDFFGHSVAIDGDAAIIGSYWEDQGGSQAGAAYLFDVTTGQQVTKLVASDTAAGDQFGSSVALLGRLALVGSPYDDDTNNNSGSGYLFDIDGDTTPPGSVFGVQSTSHSVSLWSNQTTVDMTWTSALDDSSGVDGYSVLFDQSPATDAPTTKSVEETETTYSEVLSGSTSGYYFHIRAVDNCGNWGDTTHAGPYLIDDIAPNTGAIDIAGGAASTTSPIVSLDSLYAFDEESGVVDMQFSNDGEIWSNEEVYAPSRSGWDLTALGGNADPGTKTVHVRFHDAAGNESAVFSDTINFTPAPELQIITPSRGSNLGGNTITIFGTGFTPGMTVTFGGVFGQATYVSSTELSVVVPAGPAPTSGSGSPRRLAVEVDVVVTTPHGSDTMTGGYTYTFKR